MYKPGPFDLGVGVLGKFVNICAVVWTIIVVVRPSFSSFRERLTDEWVVDYSVVTSGHPCVGRDDEL